MMRTRPDAARPRARPVRWLAPAAVAAAALTGVAASAGVGPATASPAPYSCPRPASFGPERPPACWRPYADSSPFNQRLPAHPRVRRGSGRIVARLLGFGPLQHLTAGDAGTALDYGRPTYFARPGDPVFTVHCTRGRGSCPVEGDRIRVPDAARAPGGSDGHMSVVDQASGWEYDFWRVQSKPAGGGRLEATWAGRTRIDGDGLGSYAVAARFGTAAGTLRAEELEAGEIDHALVIGVHCDSGRAVYPAIHSGAACSQLGLSNANAPAMGTRFALAMSDARIDALAVPGYRKALLRAMARYGMYVVDTGGTWAVLKESALVTTSFGMEDRWVRLARALGAPYWRPDTRYAINIRDGVDWARYLRVIDPCVARRRC